VQGWENYVKENRIPTWESWIKKNAVYEGRNPNIHIYMDKRRRREPDEGDDGNGGNRKLNLDPWALNLLRQAIYLLNCVRIIYTHHTYITFEAYREGVEINPRLMDEYRRAGNFEYFGIHDRARYQNVEDCPYSVTHYSQWLEVYNMLLSFIWKINEYYLADPLPTRLPIEDITPRNNRIYISYIRAAENLGIPPLHVADRRENLGIPPHYM
jgi:hypothetical protein